MRILHIANDFSGSKVHCNLAKTLDQMGIEQIVYCPVRDESLVEGHQFESEHTKFVYSNCIRSWYKYVYFYKERRLYSDLKLNVDLPDIGFIHAHTMFSDGGLAYKAHQEYGIKYAVAIRNTDVNDYLRLMKHTYSYGRKILTHAEKIYFISVGLKELFEESTFCKSIYEKIKNKFVVQPNGIEDYWHEHICRNNHTGHNVLYIGDFTPNKNVARLIEAVKRVRCRTDLKDCRLIIVGGGRDKDGKIDRLIRDNPEFVQYMGKIFCKDTLAEIMKTCAVFAMPSITETFGLVYLEALSQNLPVVYTKKQGIDGLFDKTVGLAVNPFSIDDISNAIIRILESPNFYNNKKVDFTAFEWKKIAENYKLMYDKYNSY